MKPGASDGLLFGIAQKLEKRGNHQRAQEIAQRITDPDMARNAEGARATPPARPVDACALASSDAKAGRFAEAY
jgi:hypothetical protein